MLKNWTLKTKSKPLTLYTWRCEIKNHLSKILAWLLQILPRPSSLIELRGALVQIQILLFRSGERKLDMQMNKFRNNKSFLKAQTSLTRDWVPFANLCLAFIYLDLPPLPFSRSAWCFSRDQLKIAKKFDHLSCLWAKTFSSKFAEANEAPGALSKHCDSSPYEVLIEVKGSVLAVFYGILAQDSQLVTLGGMNGLFEQELRSFG